MSRILILTYTLSPAPSPALLGSVSPSTASNSNSHGYASDQESSYPGASTFQGPYMSIFVVILLLTFFLMAAFSVYVRRYTFSMDGERGGSSQAARVRGLDRRAIDGLPMVVFHCAKGDSKEDVSVHANEWRRRPDCVVCLTDFQEAESVRCLPKCEHCFHPECIDMWLFSHTTCPLCRRSLLPAPAPPPAGSLTAASDVSQSHS